MAYTPEAQNLAWVATAKIVYSFGFLPSCRVLASAECRISFWADILVFLALMKTNEAIFLDGKKQSSSSLTETVLVS